MTKYREPKPVPGQEPVFYHGTRVGFKKGGYLFPPSFHHGATRPGVRVPEDDQYIYFVTDFEQATYYALNSKGRGRPKVCTVVPSGPIEHDPSTYDGEDEQYRSKTSARIVEVQFVDDFPLRGGLSPELLVEHDDAPEWTI